MNQDNKTTTNKNHVTLFKEYLKSITPKQYKRASFILLSITLVTFFYSLGFTGYDYLLRTYVSSYLTMGKYARTYHEPTFFGYKLIITTKTTTMFFTTLAHALPIAIIQTIIVLLLSTIIMLFYGYVNYYYQDPMETPSYYNQIPFDKRYGVHISTYNKCRLQLITSLKTKVSNTSDPSTLKNELLASYQNLNIKSAPVWKQYAFADAVDTLFTLEPSMLEQIKNHPDTLPSSSSNETRKPTNHHEQERDSVLEVYRDITHEKPYKYIYMISNFLFLTQNLAILIWVTLFNLFFIRVQTINITYAFLDILRDITVTIITFDVLGGIGFLILGYYFYKTTNLNQVKKEAVIMMCFLSLWLIFTILYRITSNVLLAVYDPNTTGFAVQDILLSSYLYQPAGFFYLISSYLFIFFIHRFIKLLQVMNANYEITHYKLDSPWNYYMYSLLIGITLIAFFTAVDGLKGNGDITIYQNDLFVYFGRFFKYIIAPLLGSFIFLNSFKEYFYPDLLYNRKTQ